MKNLTTPRTLADCTFSVDYPIADTRWKVRLETMWGFAVIASLGAMIGAAFAWMI